MKHSNYNQGAAMILFVLFFTFASSAMMFAIGQTIFSDLSDFNRLTQAKQAFLTADSLTEDVVYRRVYGTFDLDLVESLTLASTTAYSTTTYDSPNDIYTINTKAQRGSTIRKSQAIMAIGAGEAFNYGLQAGNGGILFKNGASVLGNIYSNGKVEGFNGSDVFGDVVSAGPSGYVESIHATGSIYANTIDHIEADKDTYSETQIGNDAQNPVGGARNVTSFNQPTTTMPISTTTIQEWKDAILDYGTIIPATDSNCTDDGVFNITGAVNYGYHKIECDVEIKDTGPGTIVNLDGPIWVEGNLSFKSGPTIKVDPSLGRQSVQIIVDNPADRITSSQVEIENSTVFEGADPDRSFIMVLSMNESASVEADPFSDAETAISISQSSVGELLLYAADGLIDLGNSIELSEVTGHSIDIGQSSQVKYESGLTSLLFTSGPGGAYVLDDWQQAE